MTEETRPTEEQQAATPTPDAQSSAAHESTAATTAPVQSENTGSATNTSQNTNESQAVDQSEQKASPDQGNSPASTADNITDAPEQTALERAAAETPTIDAAAEKEMDALMAAAAGDAEPKQDAQSTSDNRPGSSAVDAAPAKLKGPRVVEGGREHRVGFVVSVGPDDVFIEFGPKSLGIIPRTQFKDDKGEERGLPEKGEQIRVVVERFDEKEQLNVCSLPGAVRKADWEMLEVGDVVEAKCTGTNKGGLEMEVANHRAFMPASHVSDHRIEDLSVFVGEKMPCKVIKVDRAGRGDITLSRRSIIKEERKEQQTKLRESLKEGDTVQGTVKKLMPFGAFVDIGGVDALLHVSDMSYERVNKPETVVKEGDTVSVKVLKIDWEGKRHSVGLKQLQDDPFVLSLKEVEEGAVVPAKVTKLLDFGAFMEISEGIEGLCHISELDWKRVMRVSDAVQPGQVVNVKVLKIDKDQRKISLSIKQAKDRPQQDNRQRGRKRGDDDTRSADEILKETPQLRRLREQGKKKQKKRAGGGGIGETGGLGMGLGDLKL